MTTPWRVVDLGSLDYRTAWARQLELVDQRQRGEIEDTLLLVEHPHVFTLGRRRDALQNVVAPGDVEVIEIERGGDVTYHGPGQLVAYPIVLLAEPDGTREQRGERDLHKYLRRLEDGVIATCAAFGVVADREPAKTGVWTGPPERRKKLCSMGIACRKWVTFHGLALNVSTDLAYFHRINPCGFESNVMTTLVAEGATVTLGGAKATLARELARALDRLT